MSEPQTISPADVRAGDLIEKPWDAGGMSFSYSGTVADVKAGIDTVDVWFSDDPTGPGARRIPRDEKVRLISRPEPPQPDEPAELLGLRAERDKAIEDAGWLRAEIAGWKAAHDKVLADRTEAYKSLEAAQKKAEHLEAEVERLKGSSSAGADARAEANRRRIDLALKLARNADDHNDASHRHRGSETSCLSPAWVHTQLRGIIEALGGQL